MKRLMIRRAAAMGLAALLGGAAGSAWADAYSPGMWDTNFGPLSLSPKGSDGYVGLYYYKNMPAHLFGSFEPERGTYAGTWIQGTSEVRCNELQNGSPYWGTFRYSFTGQSFDGLWNYCGRDLVEGSNFSWTGTFKSPY